MTLRRVCVIGGGPAGYAAALAAARIGASVLLVEADRLGGQCVHHTCIPTAAMLSGMTAFLDAQESALAGVFDLGEEFRWSRLVARKQRLSAQLASGVGRLLSRAGVEVVAGRAALTAHSGAGGVEVEVAGSDGSVAHHACDAVVLATGARWEAPRIDGVPPERVMTADEIHALDAPPAAAIVMAGGPAATAFGVEYAFLLAAAGTSTRLACATDVVIPALDADLDPLVRGALATLGVECVGALDGGIMNGNEIVVAADTRLPGLDGLGLQDAGIATAGHVLVDRAQRTAADAIFAAGDVTGGVMTSAAAEYSGRVAGANAAGATQRARAGATPHVLHTLPEIAWIGRTEAEARDAGADVRVGIVDLASTARAVTLGNRDGACKLVADATTGEILGVHVIGAGSAEIVAVGALAIQAEIGVDQLAETIQWHPASSESLSAAARAATR